MYSDESAPPEKKAQQQVEAFQKFKQRILESAAAGRWADTTADVSRDTVLHYVSETIEAIKETAEQRKVTHLPSHQVAPLGEQGVKPVSDFLAVRFTAFFVDLVYKNPTYPALRSFGDVLRQLYVLGGAGELEDQLVLLSNLAKTKLEGSGLSDVMSKVSVFTRTPFEESTVYKSFVDCQDLVFIVDREVGRLRPAQTPPPTRRVVF